MTVFSLLIHWSIVFQLTDDSDDALLVCLVTNITKIDTFEIVYLNINQQLTIRHCFG